MLYFALAAGCWLHMLLYFYAFGRLMALFLVIPISFKPDQQWLFEQLNLIQLYSTVILIFHLSDLDVSESFTQTKGNLGCKRTIFSLNYLVTCSIGQQLFVGQDVFRCICCLLSVHSYPWSPMKLNGRGSGTRSILTATLVSFDLALKPETDLLIVALNLLRTHNLSIWQIGDVT